MGGEITVSTTLGSGSVFQFDIETHVVETGVWRHSPGNRQIVGLEAGQPSYRILIVEDKPENRLILRELLALVGFEVREATNGLEAIAVWQSWSPQLIWMDIRMPVMDGYEATKQIKTASHAIGSQAPIIIALTGSVFEQDRQIALSMGCTDFVRKPFRAEEIFEKMAEYLGVRYVYATEQGQGKDRERHDTITSDAITASDLAAMPTEWVEQLHQAATKVNTKLVLKLIEQIPKSNTHLADALTHLLNNFCFEEIVELTQH